MNSMLQKLSIIISSLWVGGLWTMLMVTTILFNKIPSSYIAGAIANDMFAFMNLFGISGELFLALAGMIALLTSVFINKDNSLKITTRICNVAFIITLVLIFISHSIPGSLFNEMYVHDALSRYTKSLILIGTILTLIISSKSQKIDGFNRPEYPVLILFSVIGMLLMASSTNLISLYMALELQSLPLYVIAAINRDNLKSSEAGLKYFILGALSSGLLLFGMSLVYGAVGDTSFSSISLISSQGMTSLLLIGLVFMLSGLAFKISLVPFHMWTPDVYEGAPTPVTAFFAIVPIKSQYLKGSIPLPGLLQVRLWYENLSPAIILVFATILFLETILFFISISVRFFSAKPKSDSTFLIESISNLNSSGSLEAL